MIVKTLAGRGKRGFWYPNAGAKLPLDVQTAVVRVTRECVKDENFQYDCAGPAASFQGVRREMWKIIPEKLHGLKVGWTVKYVMRQTGSGGDWYWTAPDGYRYRSRKQALKHDIVLRARLVDGSDKHKKGYATKKDDERTVKSEMS